ncbi:hypothetical protein BGW38_002408 [Lunasporangiospora selenospora]|uniref:Uncharacterized protein n=1 Tax=Lunasporangiospora selenospora TaxID=979761 RepID=A0A9P6FSM4_9FUNG|nr:hypothetical protein BGW38_002408 [Lunasporangiospora selenospora]
MEPEFSSSRNATVAISVDPNGLSSAQSRILGAVIGPDRREKRNCSGELKFNLGRSSTAATTICTPILYREQQ